MLLHGLVNFMTAYQEDLTNVIAFVQSDKIQARHVNAVGPFGTPLALALRLVASDPVLDAMPLLHLLISKGGDLNKTIDVLSSNSLPFLVDHPEYHPNYNHKHSASAVSVAASAAASAATQEDEDDDKFDGVAQYEPSFDLDRAYRISGRVYGNRGILYPPTTPAQEDGKLEPYFWDYQSLLNCFPYNRLDASPRRNLSIFHLTKLYSRGSDLFVPLVKLGANLEIKTNRGETAVLYHTKAGHSDTVNALVLAGANVRTGVNYYKPLIPAPSPTVSARVDTNYSATIEISPIEIALRRIRLGTQKPQNKAKPNPQQSVEAFHSPFVVFFGHNLTAICRFSCSR